MKKFLAALIVAGNFLFMPPSYASIETYVGEGSATMSEAETQDKAVDRAKLKALRDAQEKAGVYIRSQSRMRDLELVEDDVETITAGIVKIMSTNIKKTVLNDDVIQVFVTVTVQINTDDLQREIDRLLDKRKPKPPVDKPKPIETPKPQPVEEPKPEKVEPPPAKIEQPAEEPAPVEEPKPAEPIEPTPVEEPTFDEKSAPRGEIKLFEAMTTASRTTKQKHIDSAKINVRIEMAKFVVTYCKTRNLKITEDEAFAAVDFSSKIFVPEYSGYLGNIRAKGLLYIGKLNTWIEENLR